jgi:glycosyltransferase involved in cell wall biosynthesis
MEIIHVVLGKANPDRMNGVNNVVYQLATHQAYYGRDVVVWGITKITSHNYGVRNFKTHLFKAKSNIFCVDKKLIEQIIHAKERNVIFHIHGGWIPTFSTFTKLLSRHKIPFVFTPHGAYNSIAMNRSKWLKKIYFYLFEKSLLKRASTIHCIGKSEIKGIKKLINSLPLFLTPYGFEINKLIPKITFSVEQDFIIGFVGRLDIYTKGLDLLLDGFEQFQKKENNAKLWIVGDSEQRIILEKVIASKGLENNVVLWGSKFGKAKHNLMNKFHVFAHPSRNEGLPSSVLEAAAMGIPCVISEATNVGDYIRKYNCGVTVDNEDSAAITKALFYLNEKKIKGQLNKLGIQSKEMVKNEFNWEHIITEFDKLYALG